MPEERNASILAKVLGCASVIAADGRGERSHICLRSTVALLPRETSRPSGIVEHNIVTTLDGTDYPGGIIFQAVVKLFEPTWEFRLPDCKNKHPSLDLKRSPFNRTPCIREARGCAVHFL